MPTPTTPPTPRCAAGVVFFGTIRRRFISEIQVAAAASVEQLSKTRGALSGSAHLNSIEDDRLCEDLIGCLCHAPNILF